MSNLNFIEAKKVVLKKITKSDLSKVARVHIDSFPASALTKLGRRSFSVITSGS